MANKNHEKFYYLLSPIVVVFHFFGIAPLIKSSKCKNALYFIYQCASIATVIVMIFYKQQLISKLYEVTSHVTLRILLISHAMSIVEAITTKDRQLKIIKQLCRIDVIISREFCTESDHYNRMKKRYTWLLWGVFIGIVVVRTLHSIVFNRAPLVVCCVWAYAHFGISMRLLQNAFYVDMVYERLHILHEILNQLKNDSCKVQQQLNLAGDLYGKLWMMTNDINFSFGWSLMAIIVECIVDVVNEANILYFYCDDGCFYTTMQILSFTPITIVPLILLSQSCERCVITAKKTSTILHSISHFKSLRNYRTDIRLLSLQISHESFFISANGFCNVGLKTIGLMIKTCTLYSIITIQFSSNP